MRSLFSNELLADIHIRLDREGLQGLTDKEIAVLLSESITGSVTPLITEIMAHTGKKPDRLITICVKIGDPAEKSVEREGIRFGRGDLWCLFATAFIIGVLWGVTALNSIFQLFVR